MSHPEGTRPPVQAVGVDADARGLTPLARPSTAQRVAEVLRERILRGELAAGTQIGEQQLTATLGVSRNTLREAFQILVGEHLLRHAPHRGVFVRTMTGADVHDLYTFRRLVECAALEHPVAPRLSQGAFVADLRAAVAAATDAAARDAWAEVGTADVRFHIAVTAAAGSVRLDHAMRATFAELRLAFALVPDPRSLHRPFVGLNAEILALVERDEGLRASRLLRRYLDDAEARITAAVEGG